MKKLAALIFICLSGCATSNQRESPPPSPTITQIAALWSDLTASGVPPTALLNIGITLDDGSCYGWFDQQVLGAQRTMLGQSALGLGTAGAAMAGGPGGMASAAALGLTSAFLGSLQANSPSGVNPVAAYGLTLKQRQALLSALPVPASPDVAWSYLNAYHQPCTLSGINYAIAQAAMSSPVTVMPPPTIPVITTPPVTNPPIIPPPTSPPTLNPPDDNNPVITPNIRRPHSHNKTTAFFQSHIPTFQIAAAPDGNLVARPPILCIGCR